MSKLERRFRRVRIVVEFDDGGVMDFELVDTDEHRITGDVWLDRPVRDDPSHRGLVRRVMPGLTTFATVNLSGVMKERDLQ
jgi:hypothetical protein